MHARKRHGFGWNRWSRAWLYNTLGLFKPVDRAHKHSDEVNEVSVVREIRTLRLTWRGLET